ncbi:MAG TPA: hypothetical protein PKL78_05845 [Anaerolineales bacterium]|nr:hypothetical protein [Anaerolineales bacterium]HNN13061.1 hypothetical protein [Anaerolineales bacterium]
MNLKEIIQAVENLSPGELSHFRDWFKRHETPANSGKLDSQPIEITLKRLQGSLKGSGALQTLMEERRKESLL